MQNLAYAAIAAGQAGTVYFINAPFAPWLAPAVELCGLGMQVISLVCGSRPLAWLGWLAALCGAWPQRDVALATGSFLAAICLSRRS